MPDQSLLTLGVAISVPAPWGEELTGWRARVGDPAASRVPPHITLLLAVEFNHTHNHFVTLFRLLQRQYADASVVNPQH